MYEGDTSEVFVKCRGIMTLTRTSAGNPPALAMAVDSSPKAEAEAEVKLRDADQARADLLNDILENLGFGDRPPWTWIGDSV